MGAGEDCGPKESPKVAFAGWIGANLLTLGCLFALGKFLFNEYLWAVVWLAAAVAGGVVTLWSVSKLTRRA